MTFGLLTPQEIETARNAAEYWAETIDKAMFATLAGYPDDVYPPRMNAKQRKQYDTHLRRKWVVKARDIQAISRLRNERVRPEFILCQELERNETQDRQAKHQALQASARVAQAQRQNLNRLRHL